MSSDGAGAVTGEQNQPSGLVPTLRFPEFQATSGWTEIPLRKTCKPITEKVGSVNLTPVSITAGVGFVSQASKFGRDISGDQYKSYTYLRAGDFAYNKGNSKKFPQGYVCQLKEFSEAAASSAFICFRLNDDHEPAFFQAAFDQNIHGRQLSKYITSGARSDGLLNIRPDDFYGVNIPIPPECAEQQKIAHCLSSIDALIAVEVGKLGGLKAHKQGLMQQIFPAPGETAPRLRFPEFQDAGEWIVSPLGNVFDTSSRGTPERKTKEYWGGEIPWITTSLVDSNIILGADEFITTAGLKNSSAKLFPKNTVLIAMYGQGKTRGKAALLGIEASTNQACAAILPNENIDPAYVFLNLVSRYEEIRALSNSGGQENLSQGLVCELPFPYPDDVAEQKRIAAFLSSIDTIIAAQGNRIDALKRHKKGLMQQLFPVVDASGAGAAT